MNNNQDNYNDNPQMKILNSLNNQTPVQNNLNEKTLNVIPNANIENNIINNNGSADVMQNPNTFINVPVNNVSITGLNNMQAPVIEEENPLLKLNKNKFINTNEEVKDTTLNSMNVNGEYNNMPKVDYSQDPKVRENIENINKYGAKNTIKIGGEGKVFLIIIAVLLLFTFVMPIIYDTIRNLG